MLILLYTARAAPAAGSTDWTNAGTAIGTIALAFLTFITLVFTVIATTRERSQAAKDRIAADERLKAERDAGNKRVQDEREYATEVRRRDRQIDNISVLVARVAEIQAFLTRVPGVSVHSARLRFSGARDAQDMADDEVHAAISSLRHGAWTEAAMLGTGEAAEAGASRYRTLVRLIDEAARTKPFPDRDEAALRNYARWVLITLRTLAENETVPKIYRGARPRPQFGLAEHEPAWEPIPQPPGWEDIAEADPPVRVSASVATRYNTEAGAAPQVPESEP